ncbi:MAG TPA: ion channel, partial [Chitinophagaceae bacterium]|nr:ion channel [Chitinophagaceae bacterium]
MSITRKGFNPSSKANNDTGFGTGVSANGGRFVNRDGSFNLVKEGASFWDRFSLFHSMLNMSVWKFIGVIVLFYLAINLVYTSIYFAVGVGSDSFQGIIGVTAWQRFKEIYFFSTETFTTVGYGRVNPIGDGVNMVAAIEAMSGFLSFAVATGLIYGRFAKPKSHIVFSDRALIAPFQEKSAFMFRLASYKDNHNLTSAEIKVNLAMQQEVNGKMTYQFFELELERSKVDTLMMNWTVVHPITENSPLNGFSPDDYRTADVEVYVQVRGYDDVYSTNVIQRTSYTYEEIIFDAKFISMYHESEDRRTTILELDKLSAYKTLSTQETIK